MQQESRTLYGIFCYFSALFRASPTMHRNNKKATQRVAFLLRIALVIPAEGAGFGVLLKLSKRCVCL
jgi:hypothetical protein